MGKLKKIFCVFFGHSKIIDTCLGYIHCGRCGEQIGDALGGYFDGKGHTIIGHDCSECRRAYSNMGWRDKILTSDPFKKQ